MQTQVDRHRRFNRRRQAPRETRFEQHPHRLAEAGHHRRLAGLYLDEARHRERNHDAQRRQRHPPVETGASACCRAAVPARITPAGVGMRVTVSMSMRVRLIQTHNIPRSRLSDAMPILSCKRARDAAPL